MTSRVEQMNMLTLAFAVMSLMLTCEGSASPCFAGIGVTGVTTNPNGSQAAGSITQNLYGAIGGEIKVSPFFEDGMRASIRLNGRGVFELTYGGYVKHVRIYRGSLLVFDGKPPSRYVGLPKETLNIEVVADGPVSILVRDECDGSGQKAHIAAARSNPSFKRTHTGGADLWVSRALRAPVRAA